MQHISSFQALRLAYADPPYLGCCKLYGHRHEEPWGCWDDVDTQIELMVDLASKYDGWAMSTSSPNLGKLVGTAEALGARTAAWVKPFAAFKANVRIAYTWEPVLFVPARDSSKDGAPVGRDHLSTPITLRKGLTGAKPEAFCEWVLDLLNVQPGDEVVDLFPGTGVMGRVADARTRTEVAA